MPLHAAPVVDAGLPPILLVEDNDDDRYLFLKYAARGGLKNRIDVAPSGQHAIDYLQSRLTASQSLPCVVFLDIKMPIVTGFDVLAWMHHAQVAENTIVVMHSSSDDPKEIREALRQGAHAYLRKDRVIREIQQIVSAVLSAAPRPEILATITQLTGARRTG